MDHDKATKSYTIERYMLGELPEVDRDQFEEHLFNCAECAEHVRSFSRFAANAKAVLAEPEQTEVSFMRERKRSWLDGFRLSWARPAYAGLSLSALVALTSVTGYQALALRKQTTPQAVVAVVLHPEARGEETVIGMRKLGAFLLLEADVPKASGELKWEVRDVDSPNPLMSGTADAPEAGASLKLLLPASRPKPAQYILTIRSNQPSATSAATLEASYRYRID